MLEPSCCGSFLLPKGGLYDEEDQKRICWASEGRSR